MSMDEKLSPSPPMNADASGASADVNADEASNDETATRQRSTISFPYNSLQEAVEIAERLHEKAGTGECSDAQLAAWLNMSPKSSTFRVRISSTRMFGLVQPGVSEDHVLTDVGKRIIDPKRTREARVDAFLNIPLYGELFRHYDGGLIPPAAALERQIANLGVAEKQKGRARAALEKSAEFAGFFEHGKNRMVKPGIKGVEGEAKDTVPPNLPNGGSGGGGSGDGGGTDQDPMIIGLIKRLPKTEDSWTLHERQRWLETAAQIFDFIYGDEDEGRIVVKIEGSKS